MAKHSGKYAIEISEDRIDLVLGFGICLRCLAQWQTAQEVFESLIEFTGRHGLFPAQLTARLELARLYRFKGDYTQAQAIRSKLKTLQADSSAEIVMEDVEIALDLGNVDQALHLIGTLPNSPRTLFLKLIAQVEGKQANVYEITSLADQVIQAIPGNTAIIARVHTAIGRTYESLPDIEMAKAHYSLAVRLLEERDNDPYGLARAQSNLGAFLLQTTEVESARILLESAFAIQRVIKDHVGLAITQHNILEYRNRFAN